MRDVALALGGVTVVIRLLYRGHWFMGAWRSWPGGWVIMGLIMVEKGVWKIARQDYLQIPMSPAL